MIEIGYAVLRINKATGKKYWHVYKDTWKQGLDLNPKQPIQYNPDAFGGGTQIRIYKKDKI